MDKAPFFPPAGVITVTHCAEQRQRLAVWGCGQCSHLEVPHACDLMLWGHRLKILSNLIYEFAF